MEIPRHEPLVWYAPGVEAHLLALGLEDLCALAGDLSEPRLAALGVEVTRARTRRLYRLADAPPGDDAWYVKLQLARASELAPRKWVSYALQASPLLREARAAAALRAIGLRTPELLATGARGRFPRAVRALLVTREVPNHVDLERFLRSAPPPARARLSIDAVEAAVARVHQAGFALGGARYRNFLVPASGAEHADDVLVLDAAGFGRGARRRARDRGHLNLDRARFS